MRVAIYARVSTKDQSCVRQLRDLELFAARRGDTIIKTTTDKASGSDSDRPGREKILKLAQARDIDAVLVSELSRWGRSTNDLLSTLDQLHGFGVSLIAMSGMTFDLTNASGKLMATVFAGIAEFERSLLQERIRSGLEAARASGKTLGRPAGTSSTINKHKDQVLRYREEGRSYRWIAKDLQISKTTVIKIVKAATEVQHFQPAQFEAKEEQQLELL